MDFCDAIEIDTLQFPSSLLCGLISTIVISPANFESTEPRYSRTFYDHWVVIAAIRVTEHFIRVKHVVLIPPYIWSANRHNPEDMELFSNTECLAKYLSALDTVESVEIGNARGLFWKKNVAELKGEDDATRTAGEEIDVMLRSLNN
jgi:hypothetical protein